MVSLDCWVRVCFSEFLSPRSHLLGGALELCYPKGSPPTNSLIIVEELVKRFGIPCPAPDPLSLTLHLNLVPQVFHAPLCFINSARRESPVSFKLTSLPLLHCRHPVPLRSPRTPYPTPQLPEPPFTFRFWDTLSTWRLAALLVRGRGAPLEVGISEGLNLHASPLPL